MLGFSLPDDLLSGVEVEVLSEYWRHTLIKAVAARHISEDLFQVPGDDAFLSGLLQEIGVLVLIQHLGEPYVQFLNGVQAEGAELNALETATLGFDHVILSARLLDSWGLPEAKVAAIATPFDELRILKLDDQSRTLVQTLHLAEMVARLLTSRHPPLLDAVLATGGLYCDLTMSQLEQLTATLEQEVSQLAEILSLRLPGDTSYSRILAQAFAQLSSAAEEATTQLVGPAPRHRIASSIGSARPTVRGRTTAS